MDANDAASYVQDLAGDNANIIFGAKFDENMTDEATITVIATGLENPTQSSKIIPGMKYQSNTAVNRPMSSVSRPAASSPVGTGSGLHSAGLGAGAAQTGTGVNTNATPFNYGGIKKPQKPESSVPQRDIKIPEFLKNTKR